MSGARAGVGSNLRLPEPVPEPPLFFGNIEKMYLHILNKGVLIPGLLTIRLLAAGGGGGP